MKNKTVSKIMALTLAILMILPVISVPAFAADTATPTVLWEGTDFEGDSSFGSLQSYPSTATIATEANGNKAIRFEAKGVKNSKYPEAYYVVTGKNAGSAVCTAVTVSSVNGDGTVSGSVVINGTTYTFTNQSPDTNTAMTMSPALSGYVLYSGAQLDAYIGAGNVATAVKTKNPAISSTTASKIVFEADYYFSKGTKGLFSGRVRASDNDYVEMLGVRGNGDTVTIQPHENATLVSGAAKVVSTDTWIKISVLLDTATGLRYVYVNGDIIFSAKNTKLELTTPVSIKENTWDLLQLNRGNATAASIGGYVMIDNPTIYNGAGISTEIVPGFKDNYQGYSEGTKLTTAWGYNTQKSAEILAYNKVLAEADGNKFVRVPVVYDGDQTISTAGATNYDKTLMINNPAFSADDEFMILDLSFRPHGNETTMAETIELQLREYNFDLKAEDGATITPRYGTLTKVTEDISQKAGFFCTLFTINLNTGYISFGAHDSVKVNDWALKLDAWNDVRYMLNLKDASASLIVNGEIYATVPSLILTGTNWDSCTNGSNISIPSGRIIIAKCNKNNNSFKTIQEANADYSNVNYLDIDNVNVYTKTAESLVAGFTPSKYENIVMTEEKSSVRYKASAGLRFATKVDKALLDELYDMIGQTLSDVRFGTLIIPEDYLADGTQFTIEALDAAEKLYLNVEATHGAYYPVDNDLSTTHFVGSIVNIKEGNVARSFAAIGYVKVKLLTGIEYYYYSPIAYVSNVKETAQKVIDTVGLSGYTATAKKTIEGFAAGKALASVMAEDMKGLNVLALGDSLFAGTDEGTPGCDRGSQWVNLLGNQNGWTLTNLGIGGMTVSYTSANYTTKGRKASMYDWLFNDINDFRWGSSYNTEDRLTYPTCSQTYNYYYHCGDFTGKTAEDVDLIILEGGCNDYGTEIAAPLGTYDSKDPATFMGAWNCITDKLLQDYPNAKIVFITTWHLNPQSRPDNITSIEYSSSVIEIYEKNYADNDRVYLIDAGDPAVSGVNMRDTAWRSEYSNDGYHLKNNGMAVMAGNMFPLLWEIWVNSNAQ